MRHWWKLIALGLGLGWALSIFIFYTSTVGLPVDAYCYWGMDPIDPYDPARCFLYSPPIAQLMLVIQAVVPFDVFYTSLRVLEMIALAVITGPAIGPVLFIPAVVIEINAANVNILLVGAVLLGFRYPWTWAFVILTKVTPGIGLLWFVVRREWGHVFIALGVTAALSALSFVLAPWMWVAYLEGLTTEPDESPV